MIGHSDANTRSRYAEQPQHESLMVEIILTITEAEDRSIDVMYHHEVVGLSEISFIVRIQQLVQTAKA